MKSVYNENGYENRIDYLRHMAQDYDVPTKDVYALADLLGPSEDFDGLVVALQDHTGA